MTRRIFRSILAVAVAVLLSCIALVMGVLYNYFGSVQEKELLTQLALAAEGVEQSGMDYLRALDGSESRLTWIDAEGRVLFDSRSEAESMENHAEREEIRQALETGSGRSSRYSATLTEQTDYYALRLSDGTVLRSSTARLTMLALTLSMLYPFVLILAAALALSLVLARRLSRKIVSPLENINLDKPLDNDAYEELSPILTRLEMQHREIKLQKEELRERKNEFLAVIGNMREGLVLLSDNGTVLSINPAAKAFFGVRGSCTGQGFITVERDREINLTMEAARRNGSAELSLSRGGREYQLRVSRVEAEDRPLGLVISVFDITDRVFAERSRREFTANVSHELKTPLQSIMGSAELLENGLVRTEDVPRFIGRIRRESARLLALIEDIIRLSQLDEKAELSFEELELYELVREELSALEPKAAERNVKLAITGDKATLCGVRQLLGEVVFNLCDNAIKYNRDGGSVTVNVSESGENAVITVSDTGIGIPHEAQDRVFERFYRVDKSRSRQIGGTGLGLSIVKHAVQYMDGSVSLESEHGAGTAVTVTIPKRQCR
ncbi:MAG: two-component sensor histidine kinase [Oscillospiraceae bacterium]|nr:two-component sensor histidine kinase [Oscillospiraceae bacterium]